MLFELSVLLINSAVVELMNSACKNLGNQRHQGQNGEPSAIGRHASKKALEGC